MLSRHNTIVLGGQVKHMMEVQQQALEKKRRMIGMGVDATVKALIVGGRDDDVMVALGEDGE